jgi:hypothetical protein
MLQADEQTLENYIDEMSKDVELDELCVKEVQMKLPALRHKWVGRLMRHKSALAHLEHKKRNYKNQAMEKMKDNSMYGVSNAALESIISKQEPMLNNNEQMKNHKLIIEFLEKAEKIFSSLTFDIKNLIEIIKLETL